MSEPSATERCPDEGEIAAFLGGRLGASRSRWLEGHLETCDGCRTLIGALGRMAATEDDSPSSAAAPQLAREDRLDRYVILSTLGVGGMGIVYEAFDPKLGRKVALKVMRPAERRDSASRGSLADATDEEGRARLVREAKALAALAHPNVVAVYDVHEHAGDVFLAMELVEGTSLREWLREAPRSARAIQDVFRQAAAGLAAAHRQGIVHRDFKPDNVLIGKDGRVRVGDFGLARTLGETPELAEGAALVDTTPLRTRTGAIVGTPRYMAREQLAGGAADALSDQFSFCAALYEAFSDGPPFRGASVAELRANLEKRPDPPARAPAWLQRVVLRGLSPSPAARFRDMDALVRELERDGAQRWRRIALATAFVLAAAAVVVAGTRDDHAPRCKGASRYLAGVWDTDREQLLQGRLAANGFVIWERLRPAVDAYAAEWVRAHEAACEATHVFGVQSAEMLDRRMACLDDRRRRLSALLDSAAEAAPTALPAPLQAGRVLAAAYGLEPISSCADPQTLRSGMPLPADETARAEVKRIADQLARVEALTDTGRWDEGVELAKRSLAEGVAVAHEPTIARAHFVYGRLCGLRRDEKGARDALEAATAAAQASRADEIGVRAFAELVYVHGYLRGDPSEAARVARFAHAALRRVGSPELRRAELLKKEAVALNTAGRFAEGIKKARESVATFERARGRGHPHTATAIATLANLNMRVGRYQEALDLHERARAAFERAYGSENVFVAMQELNLGSCLRQLGRLEESLSRTRRCLDLRRRILGADHPDTAAALNNLGNTLDDLGRHEEALDSVRSALAIFEKHLAPNHLHTAAAHSNVANQLEALGRRDEALPHREAAVRMRARGLGDTNPFTLQARWEHAATLVRCGRAAEGDREFEVAFARFERRLGADHPQVADALAWFADALVEVGRSGEALPLLRRALAIRERKLGRENPRTGAVLSSLGRALSVAGRRDEAVKVLERALAIAVRAGIALQIAAARFDLARTLWGRAADRARSRSLADSALAQSGKSHLAGKIRRWLGSRAGEPRGARKASSRDR